jgi:hypothetical protein
MIVFFTANKRYNYRIWDSFVMKTKRMILALKILVICFLWVLINDGTNLTYSTFEVFKFDPVNIYF